MTVMMHGKRQLRLSRKLLDFAYDTFTFPLMTTTASDCCSVQP